MYRKLLSVLLTAALVGGLLIAAALPAAANHTGDGPPPVSLLPDDDGWGAGFPANFLSDKSDGTDQLAHLTAIAPGGADRVEWRRCSAAVTAPVDNADLAAGCNVTIGEDTTPAAAATGFAANEAYDVTWNIDVSGTFDFAVLACVGTEDDIDGGDCVAVLEEGVVVEDTNDADLNDTTAGEMTEFCTATPLTDCLYDTNEDGDTTDAGDADTGAEKSTVDARFKPYTHGQPVPNGGVVIRATTSTELDASGELFADVALADNDTDADAVVASDACTNIFAGATNSEFECHLNDAAIPDTTSLAIGIDNNAFGTGNCTGVFCILDGHYSPSQARAAVSGVATFSGVAAGNADFCEDPDKEERNMLGFGEWVDFCITDQFGDPFAGAPVTFEDGGTPITAGFDCAVGGTTHDHDDDGYDDHCHEAAGADGVASAFVDNPDDQTFGTPPAERGVQAITVCVDPENGGTAAAPPANHGCADDTVKDTVNKDWFSLPSEVDLVYAGTGDPADPCDTGDAFRENRRGQTDSLLVCTFDAFENPTTTDQVDGGRLQWRISPSGGGDRTGVEFTSPPPSETDATTAQATAEITATRRSNNDVCVEIEPEDPEVNTLPGFGDTGNDCVQKAVSPGGGGRAASAVTIRGKFRGRVKSSLGACRRGRRVLVKKVRSGPDATVGTDRANRRGKWRVRKPNARGRFYAQVRKNAQCRGDRSKIVRRR
jgi:hypothetical protein